MNGSMNGSIQSSMNNTLSGAMGQTSDRSRLNHNSKNDDVERFLVPGSSFPSKPTRTHFWALMIKKSPTHGTEGTVAAVA